MLNSFHSTFNVIKSGRELPFQEKLYENEHHSSLSIFKLYLSLSN
ncbi:MAG: hypothetical protein BAJALOKI3v1_130054 [Promethearchaeota archaeon]|nr:MAG: hypothetical protein BAJALOKI3v1_130054 [Candidatus Lokiarchaeota archaeon]